MPPWRRSGRAAMPRWEDQRFHAGAWSCPSPPEALRRKIPRGSGPAIAMTPCAAGSTTGQAPRELKILWAAPLGGWPTGAIAEDWRCNYFIRDPIGPPVVAGGWFT